MHTADNLPGYPFVWRRAGDNPAPLNAGIRKTTAKATAGTPRQSSSFGSLNGTISGLSAKAQQIAAFKPNAILLNGSAPALPKSHGGAYSKAAPGSAPKVVAAHLMRPAKKASA